MYGYAGSLLNITEEKAPMGNNTVAPQVGSPCLIRAYY